MVNAMGQIGYAQTTITIFQAPWVTPESNAIVEIPAANSQKTREAKANNCEAIIQIRIGVREREASFVSKAILP